VDLGIRDRKFIVLGGTRGIGLSAARALSVDGAVVAIVGRDETAATTAAAALEADTGSKVIGLSGDLTVAGEADRLVTTGAEQLDGLHGLAITTGLGARGQRELLHASDDDWVATFDDVLFATVRACRAAVPRLIEGGGGSIVTTAAYSIRSPKAHQVPYSTLKAAVATFTKNLAKSFGSSGVRANCVCPGATETDVLAAMRDHLAVDRGWPVEEALERSMADDWGMHIALGRVGKPQELGDVIAFLLSERASYVTGALINVDGGTDF
jgi:NAD(P)-dependent dehydrogenase (short-subunit alcohol dehydrogenase family)